MASRGKLSWALLIGGVTAVALFPSPPLEFLCTLPVGIDQSSSLCVSPDGKRLFGRRIHSDGSHVESRSLPSGEVLTSAHFPADNENPTPFRMQVASNRVLAEHYFTSYIGDQRVSSPQPES